MRGGMEGGSMLRWLPLALIPALLFVTPMGYILFHPNSDCSNLGQAPSYQPSDTSLVRSCGAWVTVGGTQYSVWDYRLGPPTNLLRQQVVTNSANGNIVFDNYVTTRVLTLRLVLTSAQIVQATYSTLSQVEATSQIASSVSSLLEEAQLPAAVTAGLDNLQNLVQQGADKAAPIANAVIGSATQASVMTSSRTEGAAESFLESLVVTGVAGASAGTKAVLVLILVEAAVQLSVPLGSWVDALNSQLAGSTPILDVLQSTYGQAQL